MSSATLDVQAIRRDRAQGHSLLQIAKMHQVSKATVCRVLHVPEVVQ